MGTLSHTGRSGWIWKVAEFSNLNQSELNTSCCCISKRRRWMRGWLGVAPKPKERGSFLGWRRAEPFTFPVLAPHSILPRRALGSLDLCNTRSNWQSSNCPSQPPYCKCCMNEAYCHFLFPPFGCWLTPTIALKSWLLFLITRKRTSFIKMWIMVQLPMSSRLVNQQYVRNKVKIQG